MLLSKESILPSIPLHWPGLVAIYSLPFSDATNAATFVKVTKAYPPPPRHASSVVTAEWVDGDDNNGLANAGETLMRTYTVENGGTTTLSNLCVTDEKFGADCLACTVSNNGELSPAESFVCTVPSLVSCLDWLTAHLQRLSSIWYNRIGYFE